MVTGRRSGPIARPPASRQVKLYIREWRKFMGVKAPEVAAALDIERESYLKMERETWRISLQEAVIIAKELGVSVDQLKFPAPAAGEELPESLDAMIENKPDHLKKLIRGAVKGMIQ